MRSGALSSSGNVSRDSVNRVTDQDAIEGEQLVSNLVEGVG